MHKRIYRRKPVQIRYLQENIQMVKYHKRVHTNDKPFTGDAYSKQLEYNTNLLGHEQIHTRGNNKAFTKSGELVAHR